MADVRLILCVHNHQPVGNLDHVIEEAYAQAYRPFLDAIERYPAIPWVLHNSGCLWEWLETHHPEYIARVQRLVAEGRLELLGGGFYEPILPALASPDRRGQITRMRDYLRQRFGVEAQGLWLAERVWEPDLPADLVPAGVTHLPLDDTQLHQVGVAPEQVRGTFQTESGGQLLRIFPALMSLRYKIPYEAPEAVADFLVDPFPGGGGGLAVYADDGEKFGGWPGTHAHVYGERWLERFLQAVTAAAPQVTVTTFARELASRPPLGLVYLPTGSYAEMGQWALPPEHQQAYHSARRALRDQGLAREAELFVRGGFWRNFFARYPESNWMHLRAHRAAERCRALAAQLPAATVSEARDHLWRAQCNCAYWHGIFGGLYLPHLRAAIYRELIAGERLLEQEEQGTASHVALRAEDLDADGQDELVLANASTALFIDPDRGGRLVEWDDRVRGVNLINVLSRRPEFYHRELAGGPGAAAADRSEREVETIHARVRSKEQELASLLVYDAYDRAALADRFFRDCPSAGALRRGTAEELGDFLTGAYAWREERSAAEVSVELQRQGKIRLGGEEHPLTVTKRIRLGAAGAGFVLEIHHRNSGTQGLRVWAALENHLNPLAPHGPERFLLLGGDPRPHSLGAVAAEREVGRVAVCDSHAGWRVTWEIDPAVTLLRYPVETVSLSESGAERNYQGTALLFALPLELGPGEELSVRIAARVEAEAGSA